MGIRNPSFPKPISEIIATIADIFRHQGRSELLEIVESAHAGIDETDYDNWNGGTSTWVVRLEIPVPLYASIEKRLAGVENEICSTLAYLERLYPNDKIGGVTIIPTTAGSAMLGQHIAPGSREILRIWEEDKFRLFLSHTSAHKVVLSELKKQLTWRGISSFVAHVDIEPSFEWQKEIEYALRSMHALAALTTPDFHASLWTDQEVGWALGRGVLVLPVRLGVDPYGFAGKYQGISGTLEEPAELASLIVDALLANSQTHGEMRRSLVKALAVATSFTMACSLVRWLPKMPDLTDEEKRVLQKACIENRQVGKAWGVVEAISRACGNPQTPELQPADGESPF